MTSTSQTPSKAAGQGRAHKHVHHGRTPAAWVGTLVGLLAFIIGGIAVALGPNWVMFWIAVGVAVVALILTQVLRSLGYGAD